MLLHGGGGGHSVEELALLAVLLDDLAPGLVVPGKHAAQHHKVRARANRLGHVAGARTAAVLLRQRFRK